MQDSTFVFRGPDNIEIRIEAESEAQAVAKLARAVQAATQHRLISVEEKPQRRSDSGGIEGSFRWG